MIRAFWGLAALSAALCWTAAANAADYRYDGRADYRRVEVAPQRNYDHHDHHDYHADHHVHYRPAPVVVRRAAPAPVYYVPAPSYEYVAPQPTYAPQQTYYQPSGLSFGLSGRNFALQIGR